MRAPSQAQTRSNLAANDADLWMVLAIIQPFKLDTVTLALEEIAGFGGMTVSDCRGFGHRKLTDEATDDAREARHEPPRSNEREASGQVLDFTRKVRLEIAVAGREAAELVIETIAHAAHTGRRGDGKIFAWPLSAAVRIKTFDKGSRAL